VAIAQVLALRPRLLLTDEPFAALDAIVRTRITQDLLDLVEREGISVLLVTHDLEEAISVSDVVHVPSNGPRENPGRPRGADPPSAKPARCARRAVLRALTAPALERPGRRLDARGGRAPPSCGAARARRRMTTTTTSFLQRLWVRRSLALGLLVALWELAGRAGLLDPLYASAPSEVARVAFGLFADGSIWPHLEATLTAALLEPVMMLLNAVPRVILAPLFVTWMGIDLGSKVALATVLVAVLVFFSVYSGVKEVDQRLVERVPTLGGGRRVLVREVYVPSVVAWVMGNLKVAVGFAFTGAVVGEFVASSRGLGHLLQFAQSTYNASLSLALVVLIMGFVLALFSASERLERHLLRWQHR